MVLRPEPIAAALDALAPAGLGRVPHPARPGRRAVRPGPRHRPRGRGRTSCSSAPATRASTTGCAASWTSSCRSATTSSRVARLPALVVIDAVLRLLPGAIDAASTVEESFSHGLLEYPQYTRPPVFRDMAVPDVLTSGHHAAVAAWRHEQAVERTRRQRPDLLPAPSPARTRDAAGGSDGGPPRRAEAAVGEPPGPSGREQPAILRHRPSQVAPCPPYARRRPRPGAAPGSDPVTVLDEIVADQISTDLPEIAPGDTVRVSVKVSEGTRERIQVFEGTVMRMRGGGITRSITVRALRSGVGRGAHLQGQLAAHREDRGRAPRRRAPQAALLPAQARGQGRHAPRAPRLDSGRGFGRRGDAAGPSRLWPSSRRITR